MSVIAAKFQLAVTLFENGRIADADRLCREILRMDPRHCDALHLRGLAALQEGDMQAGIGLIARSLAINANQPLAHSNVGNALLKLNRVQEALAAFDRALHLDPDLTLALYNRGHALLALGRYQEALTDLTRALQFNPNDAEALKDHGHALLELGRPAEALTSLDQALRLNPDIPETLNNRARALVGLDRHEEALADFDRALRLHPGFAEALNNRGSVLLGLKRYDEALIDLDHTVGARPDLAEAHSNRSMVLFRLKRYEEAMASADRALALRPTFAEALNNRGLALVELSRVAEARDCYRLALQILPNFTEARKNLGICLGRLKHYREALAIYDDALLHEPASASVHFNRALLLLDMSRHQEAAEGFVKTLECEPDFPYVTGYSLYADLLCCDWTNYRNRTEAFVSMTADGARAGDPLQILFASSSPADHLRCARIICNDHFPASAPPGRGAPAYRHSRIRVAYLSADFGEHPVSHAAAGLFERHDRSRFETIAMALQSEPQPTPMRERMVRAFERFYDVSGISDREVAALLRDLEVDIVVDLNGHTAGGRPGIFALRPAAVQVNYLGYPGTSGAEYMDYVIADAVVVPLEDADFYAERVVHLPHTFFPCDDRRPVAVQTPSRQEAGLPEDGFVFCAFNNSCKINPVMFDIWMRLLGRTSQSVLWLRSSNDAVQRNLRREAYARGIAAERLVFSPRIAAVEGHLARHRLADLFLDTLPYNAHSTAADALWAGLPVLTCIGSAFAGRVAASLLDAVGLPDLITRDLEEYEALAYALATTPPILAGIRARLAANRTTYPLFDTDRFCRHLESAYTTMWERNQRGEPPASFNVQPLAARNS